MTILMRCTTAHWQGDKLIPQGAIRRQGHPDVIDAYFEPYNLDDDDEDDGKPAPKRGRGK